MNTPILQNPRRQPDCPSELELDRFEQAELDPARKMVLDAHVPTCPDCQARIAERQALMNAISAPERRRMINHIMEAAAAAATPATPWWRRWLFERPLMPAFAAACAMAIAFISLRGVPELDSGSDGLRTKGALGLTVYREHAGAVELASSGETMAPGDRLRFGIEVPAAGHAMIVGIEASGSAYVCYPTNGSERSAEVSAGRTEALPGAIALDDSTGRESLHLIHCPEPFSLDEVTPIDAGRLAERGCRLSSFELSKQMP